MCRAGTKKTARKRTFYAGARSPWRDAVKEQYLRLYQLHVARSLDDLKNPPGNNLELLRGDRKGQMSIRINQQWRLCFMWVADGVHHVEIVDYH